MIVVMKPGETLLVQLHESDGEIKVEFDVGGDGHFRVTSDLPDTSGRDGVIYDEDFSLTPMEREALERGEDSPAIGVPRE